MSKTGFDKRSITELLSVAGIMVLFVYLDMTFGVLGWFSNHLLTVAPVFKGNLVTLAGGLWMGLLVYSYFKRSQSRIADRAKRFLETSLEKLKLIDPVTGLSNREGLECVVRETALLSDVAHWSVLGIEISNMKSIRNIYGKDGSVAVEVEFAKKLSELVSSHEFLAHDEYATFYVISVGEQADEIVFRMDQIVEHMSLHAGSGVEFEREIIAIKTNYVLLEGNKFGPTELMTTGGGIVNRIKFAIQQSARKDPVPVIVFDGGMEEAMRRCSMIEESLAMAIERQEIVPYFQPFIDLKTNEIVGLEVLARWLHPDVGTIPPIEFISVAEEQGKLSALTVSILEQVCTAAESWPKNLVLAINVSPSDLQIDKLVNKLIEIVGRRGVDPGRIEIEITENAFIEEADNVSKAVSRLKDHGMSIAIDDFGTGYSSLRHLRLLPFDKIKIDQSFIRDVASNPESFAIVRSVIALGDSLGLQTIAEGIEEEECREVLEQLGCNLGQGFLFAKPMPAEKVGAFLVDFDQTNRKLGKVA